MVKLMYFPACFYYILLLSCTSVKAPVFVTSLSIFPLHPSRPLLENYVSMSVVPMRLWVQDNSVPILLNLWFLGLCARSLTIDGDREKGRRRKEEKKGKGRRQAKKQNHAIGMSLGYLTVTSGYSHLNEASRFQGQPNVWTCVLIPCFSVH